MADLSRQPFFNDSFLTTLILTALLKFKKSDFLRVEHYANRFTNLKFTIYFHRPFTRA
jgi:hypothetical protein